MPPDLLLIPVFPLLSDTLDVIDIPVFDQLPIELRYFSFSVYFHPLVSVVSGVITTVVQTTNSHVNLKSKERGSPNMVILNLNDYPCVTDLDGSYVHLVFSVLTSLRPDLCLQIHLTVSKEGWKITPVTLQEVTTENERILSEKQWIPLYFRPTRTIQPFDELCTSPVDCLDKKHEIGTKAASLAFLRRSEVLGTVNSPGSMSESVGYDLSPVGFGIPFQHYLDVLHHPDNLHILTLIEELSALEEAGTSTPQQRIYYSTEIQNRFYNATIPTPTLSVIMTALNYFHTRQVSLVKFRSSSNAEDLPGFDGAGLYNSYPVNLNKVSYVPCTYNPFSGEMQPRTIRCGLLGVYASLWNQRAIEERTYARFQHLSAVMGVAVIPRYRTLGTVTGNSVSITRLMEGNSNGRASYNLPRAYLTEIRRRGCDVLFPARLK